MVNYGHNQTAGFRERCGQSLVKVGQTRSNLIDGLETTRFCEIHIRILIIGIEKYGDILVLVKFKNIAIKLHNICPSSAILIFEF